MANVNDLAHAPTLQLSILAAGEKGTFFPFRCMVHRILMHDGSLPFRPVARSLSCFLTVSLSLSSSVLLFSRTQQLSWATIPYPPKAHRHRHRHRHFTIHLDRMSYICKTSHVLFPASLQNQGRNATYGWAGMLACWHHACLHGDFSIDVDADANNKRKTGPIRSCTARAPVVHAQ